MTEKTIVETDRKEREKEKGEREAKKKARLDLASAAAAEEADKGGLEALDGNLGLEGEKAVEIQV